MDVLTESAARRFDIFDVPDGYIDDPYPWLRGLREGDPIHANADGSVLLTRYRDVRAVWRDPTASVAKDEMFRERFGEGPLLAHHTTGMLFRDPPDHDRLREIVNPFFTRSNIAGFQAFLEATVDQLLDNMAESGTFDLVTDFAEHIPASMITRILGVPPEDAPLLRQLGLQVLFPLNPRVPDEIIEAGHAAAGKFVDYITERLAEVRRRGVDGTPSSVLEAVVAAESDGAAITPDESVHMCLLVFNGGHETTTNLIAVGTHGLLQHPTEFARLAEIDDRAVNVAVEEIVRYVSPLQLQGRRTTAPIELPSGSLPAGTEVVLCQASANRDEQEFAEPERLDLSRKPNGHLAFGFGVHTCLGNQLARLEARVVLPRLARRLPDLKLAGAPVFNPNVRFRGLSSLPVRIGDAA
ncbi:cytochrome P450 (plasmid) [Pseudonocardia sp. EC080610-09]|uniref:cytochrome P450 n=1 Tax=unclassified Pseudonocardia TaxID=2619320 RepID=UPI00070691FF|nr:MULTISPECIES: cytochrome P450 [unclassified Pseudonocardia]ALL79653.1 cytochrome P450 [Pseudonocardia sp. EC080610-09]ALL85390.1 cytochrome P450 [Pseudonocardia sp. EC080619-01]